MTCTNCGDAVLAREYTLRFSLEEASDREVEMLLCTDCLRELRSEPTVELVDDATFASRE